MPRDSPRIALATLLAGAALGIVLVASGGRGSASDALEHLATPRALPSFALETDRGPLVNADLADHWTVWAFGYLSCPDVCPTSLAELAVLNAAAETPLRAVFVSVDGTNDSPDALGAYVRYFDPAFIGARASPNDLEALATTLGIRYASAGGEIGHSIVLSVVDPAGRVRARLRPGFDAARAATALDALASGRVAPTPRLR